MNANREPPGRASSGEDSRLQEDIVAFERVVPGDFFIEHACVTCGYRAALFVIAGGRFFGRYVSLCPLCAFRRIVAFRNDVDVTPFWVVWLQCEVRSEVEGQTQRFGLAHDEALWDSFYKCGLCGRLVTGQEARWHILKGDTSSPAYCPDCSGIIRGDGRRDVGRWIG